MIEIVKLIQEHGPLVALFALGIFLLLRGELTFRYPRRH